jgi:hypothetical protein
MSHKSIAANRLNAKRSRGPRTRAGKARASRNSLRHGLSTVNRHHPVHQSDIERIAKAICGADESPLLRELALTIAENEVLLHCVDTERTATIERLRDATAIPIRQRGAQLAQAKARIRDSEIAYEELGPLQAKLGITGFMINAIGQTKPRTQPPAPPWVPPDERQERDEFAVLQLALPDLLRLARYERRAWSRRKRAIRELCQIRLRKSRGKFD